jgi:hypothetical protein
MTSGQSKISVNVAEGERPMTDHIYKVVELVGSSETSIEDAVSAAIAKANKTKKYGLV